MAEAATSTRTLDLIAPGSRVVVRDQDWQVTASSGTLREPGQSFGASVGAELVRDQPASFFSDLRCIEPEDPTVPKH